MPMVLFKILSQVLKEWFKHQTWWETCFLFDLHTLSLINLLLLSFYISITNITCKPETWSTFLDHTLSSVQSLGCVWFFVTPWTAARLASPSITNSQSLLKLMSIKSVMPSNHLILCCPLSSCLQSFPASGSFPRHQFFASRGQSIQVSASTLVFPMNIQNWSPLGGTGWISLQSKGLSRVFSNTTVQKHQFFGTQLLLLFFF